MTTHPEVPQATAREAAIEVGAKAALAWTHQRSSEPLSAEEFMRGMFAAGLDALLAATQEDGAPLVILGPEQVVGGWCATHHLAISPPRRHAGIFGCDVEPLFRAPFIEAQREEA